ncbi:MAG: hypothetical protein GY718_11350, partial [Lentisphaerae bacterium]|nr:hypothetical protein [Lentisphaerota bacterium]
PLEIPFFSLIHVIAAYLLNKEITIDIEGFGEVKADIWSVLLASSGDGKSFTKKQIKKILDVDQLEFPNGAASAARWIQDLQQNNKRIWIRDEFGQFLKSIQNQPHMEEIKDYLLRIYDNDSIERSTSKYSIQITDPALVILGYAVLEKFPNEVSADDMIDGFAQRFSYIIAERDSNKCITDFPLWNLENSTWKSKWEEMVSSIKFNKYTANSQAITAYKTAFTLLYKKEVPNSFFRRIIWRAHKYALIYHVITGKGEVQEIDAQDYGWAGRVLYMHVQDSLKLLESHGLSDLEKMIQKAEKIKIKFETQGKTIKPRDLISSIRAIRNTNEAKAILSII